MFPPNIPPYYPPQVARGPRPPDPDPDIPCLTPFHNFLLIPSDFPVDAPLGKGTFGCVYRAIHNATQIPVAIKEPNVGVMPEKQQEYFRREVEILIRSNGRFLLRMCGCADVRIHPRLLFFDCDRIRSGWLALGFPAEAPARRTCIAYGRECFTAI
jgi:hypothetical protein